MSTNFSFIEAISSYLPEKRETLADLGKERPDWEVEKSLSKTGVAQRYLSAQDECASDLAVKAARALFDQQKIDPSTFDYLILCTQSPDYLLPTTACLLQSRLGLSTSTGCLDINLGCSGYIYGLGLAQGLIQSGQASNILFLCADTYTKFIDKEDRTTRLLFSDGATATWIKSRTTTKNPTIFVYGTDGSGGPKLMVENSGCRFTATPDHPGQSDSLKAGRLFMDGNSIFLFTISEIPKVVARLLEKAQKSVDQIDHFVFHQASRVVLDKLVQKIGIPEEKMAFRLEDVGNTVSSSVPLVLQSLIEKGRLKRGQTVMLVGFGVGLSWGACLIEW